MKEFFEKYKTQLMILGAVIVTYFLYFHNLWGYKLLDVDETRYVDMARCMHKTKDFMTLYLNGQYFFEKPPLYFWLENLSFTIFHTVNEFVARIPTCIEGIIASLALFFATKKYTKNLKLAILSSLILLTSAEFVILSKIAILDILLASTVTLSILAGFMTFSCQENHKKYYWWAFYLFSALAVLAKGIPGIALPFGTMFFAGIYTKKLKEFFRLQYLLVGFALFLLISLPWHIIMLNQYDPLFFNEYIIKHHVARFMGADVIHRQQPFWFYMPVILWGILPFAASFIAMLVEKCAKIKGFKYQKFAEISEKQQFLNLCIIATLVVFFFFSTSGTKLVTYILPIFPYLAVLLGNYWLEYVENDEHKKGISISTYIFYGILIFAAVVFPIVVLFLKDPVKSDLLTILIPTLITLTVFPILGLIALKREKKYMLFLSFVLFMAFLSGFGFHKILEMNYRFGENDLVKYAQYAKDNGLKIYTYQTGARYSLLYYSQDNVKFNLEDDENLSFEEVINNPENIVIVRKKHFDELPMKDFEILDTGRKYMMLYKK